MPQIDVSVRTPEAAGINRHPKMLKSIAGFMVVDSAEAYASAGDTLKEIKAKFTELDTQRKSFTKPMDTAKSRIMTLFKAPLEFLKEAEADIKGKMIAYANEQKRIQAAEEARARKAQRMEQARLEKEAVEAAKQGDIEAAALLEEKAEMVPVSAAVAPVPAAVGISTRQIWQAEVTDVDALMRAVLAREVTPDVFNVNMALLNSWARSMKSELKVPGVRAKSVDSIAARR